MSYKIQKLETKDLHEVLASLLPGSLSRTRLSLALRDGPQPVGRVIDDSTGNFLMELPKEARSPGDSFYCFRYEGTTSELLMLRLGGPDLIAESPLPSALNHGDFLRELASAFKVYECGLTIKNGEVVAIGGAVFPVIKG